MELPLRRTLVANRGEIACRIIRTLHELGLEAVAVYSDADRGAAHVAQADQAVRLGPGPPEDSYLRSDRVLQAALDTGCDSVHPGYGFLSERAGFATGVEAAGPRFVGPTPVQLRDFGDKHVARRLAAEAGVPLLPGSGLLADPAAALAAASAVGYPVMLKSSAGGGGIGMGVCDDPPALALAFERVRRLATANFGSGDVFLERFVSRARHVEVQVFGDGAGDVVALGERDCSTQRRHQKLIEEAPAPALPAATRQALVDDACALATAVRYRSAGTVEFLVDADTGQHWFLEVNTRLQVEHGVTELLQGVDLVAWMVRLAAGDRGMFAPAPDPETATAGTATAAAAAASGRGSWAPRPVAGPPGHSGHPGHAIEARVYAENPVRDFQPSAGVLTRVQLPSGVRCDGWVASGTEVTPFYDPLLVKLLAVGGDRGEAIARLDAALAELRLDGVETNADHLRAILADERFRAGEVTTGLVADVSFRPAAVEVLDDGGGDGGHAIVTSWPGRTGYWFVGVPPSGPMDDLSFRLGNQLLGNPDDGAGLELTTAGPRLRFHRPTTICLTGADMSATLVRPPAAHPGPASRADRAHPPAAADTAGAARRADGTDQTGGPRDAGGGEGARLAGGGEAETVAPWTVVAVPAGAELRLGRVAGPGARAYLLVRGGFDVPEVLGSRTTFVLGRFGGHAGRALAVGDLVRVGPEPATPAPPLAATVDEGRRPRLTTQWELAVLDGPQGAPDYLTEADVELLYASDWEVHYNSARTGVRLVGPRLSWARPDGGEAGLHPSNIHDNAYAVGTVDFTGDMPVILGPDGPSLGGFVCPATVVDGDLWKLGQLRAGDTVRFVPVRPEIEPVSGAATGSPGRGRTVLAETEATPGRPALTFRRSGERHLLVEVGPPVLDLDLRVRVHQLAGWFAEEALDGLCDLTPGIRSLQLQVDGHRLTVERAIELVRRADAELPAVDDAVLTSRIVHLPLSWNDPAVQKAIEIYMRSVRPDAPWCPSNLEFIRRINGLDSIDDVRSVVYGADYVVYGLGDVYLGAPVATPLDPRHRLVTTKYNPARTWTPENAVGIGGAYLCIYGMEGPGGYQFVGRSTQMWQRWPLPGERSWLLDFFDRIRFFPVDADELLELRADSAAGRWRPETEDGTLSIAEHHRFLGSIAPEARAARQRQQQAFAAERAAWEASGELAAAAALADAEVAPVAGPGAPGVGMIDPTTAVPIEVADGGHTVTAPLTARVASIDVGVGDAVTADETLLVLEAMKTETAIRSPAAGVVLHLACEPNQVVTAGQLLAVVAPHGNPG